MKKAILLIFFLISLKVSAQQTFWTPGVPPGSTSFSPTFRFLGTDSLANIYFSNGSKWWLGYTATQQNLKFLQKTERGPIWNRKGTVMSANTALEAGNIGEPTVIYEGNAQILTADTMVFKMWYGGGFVTPYVFYAESVDGVSWTRYPTAVVSNHNRTFVFKNSSTYYMYAANTANTQLDQFTSSDGITWTLAHSAVVTAGGIGVSYTYSPFIFIESGVWKMMLECGIGAINGNGVTYYLTSTDGITWVQGATNPVVPTWSAGNPYVFKVGSTYWMYGHGTGIVAVDGTPADIYRQSSTDLINWSAPLMVFPRRSVDEGPHRPTGQVGDLSMLQVGNSMYLWYVADQDGTTPAGGAHIKLAIANMTLAQLVTTTENDGGDINVQPPNFIVNPTNQNLSYTGGDQNTFTLNAPLYPDLAFTSNGTGFGFLGSGISSHLTGPTDLSLINVLGGGNISIESESIYLYGRNFLTKAGNFGSTASNSYGDYNFTTGGNFNFGFIYKGSSAQQLYLTNAGNAWGSPQNTNDAILEGTGNIIISRIAGYDQIDGFAAFSTQKALVLNGGNSAGFIYDSNLISSTYSTTKGVLWSSMTTTQKNAISAPTEGEMLYDNTLHAYNWWDGSAWVGSSGGGGGGTVTSITPGVGFTSHTPITASGTMDIDTAFMHGLSQPQITTLASRIATNTTNITANNTAIGLRQLKLITALPTPTGNRPIVGDSIVMAVEKNVKRADSLAAAIGANTTAIGLRAIKDSTYNINKNLYDVLSKSTARSNLDVYSTAQTNAAIATVASTIPVGGNPTATAGLNAVNGTSLAWMRADAAPKVDSTVFKTNASATTDRNNLITRINVYTPSSTNVVTNKDLSSGTNTFPTFNQNTTGSAAKWTSPITINLSGVTATGQSIDGSGNVTIPVTAVPTSLFTGTLAAGQFPAQTGDITNSAGSLATTLKNTGTAGTYGQVTTDAQGRVTSGTIINPIATGGTGSATQNFVDLSTNQTGIAGNKSFTGLQTITKTALGSSTTDALLLNNTTAAINGTQQVTPAIHYSGQGFGTTAGTSQSVDALLFWRPVQGAAPTGQWVFQTSINGAAYADKITFSAGGSINAGNNITAAATLTTGAAGGTNGTVNIAGSTSGLVSIVPQVAAGTYNFNLPTSAGTSGQILTSAGGGSSPMTWSNIPTYGAITLVAGVGTATVTGVTTGSFATTGFVSIGGTVSTTWQYKVVCTTNTVTITAITNAGTTDTSDTSTLNYAVKL